MKKILLVTALLLSTLSYTFASDNNGLIKSKSTMNFDKTVNEIKDRINSKKLTIFTIIDHSKNAKNVNLKLAKTKVIIFGNPNIGTLLMQDSASTALDLPQKILVVEENDNVNIYYNSPKFMQKRHGISAQKDKLINKISGLLKYLTTFK